MRVLVCGDRRWVDWKFVYRTLDELRTALNDEEEIVVIHGAAKGADTFAGNWALDRQRTKNVMVEEYPADWARYGRGAGPVRNRQMLVEGRPDLVIAFHDAITASKGTRNMLEQAEEAGVEVWLLGHVDKLWDGGSDE